MATRRALILPRGAPLPPLHLQELRVLVPTQPWRISARGGGGHDLLTVSPLLESAASGATVAALGLVNMLNVGGAVLAAELAGKHVRAGWERGAGRRCEEGAVCGGATVPARLLLH